MLTTPPRSSGSPFVLRSCSSDSPPPASITSGFSGLKAEDELPRVVNDTVGLFVVFQLCALQPPALHHKLPGCRVNKILYQQYKESGRAFDLPPQKEILLFSIWSVELDAPADSVLTSPFSA